MEQRERAKSTEENEDMKDYSFIEKPAVLDKYKAASQVANDAIAKCIELCKVDADIYTICQEVDKFIEEGLRKVFNNKKSKKLERGIAFPTCLSVNNVAEYYSPLVDESSKIQDGDVVKIELGAHLDGYIAQVGTTVVVGAGKATGRKADVVKCAYNAFLAAQRMIKEANTNHQVSEVIAKVCEEFKCTPVENVYSHKLKKHLIDGNDVIANKEVPERKIESFEFMPGDVISLQVMVSTGEGKCKESELRTTVFKRELDQQYSLKSKNSRAFFNEVNKKYPTLPFSIRAIEDQISAKVGVRECVAHDMLSSLPVMIEKPNEYIAQFRCTIAVQPRSTVILAGALELNATNIESELKVENEDLKKIIDSDLWKKEKEKEKKQN